MNTSTALTAVRSESKLLVLYLLRKMAKRTARWGAYGMLGVLAWLLFDPLPPVFFWLVIGLMLGSMSLHTVLYRKPDASFFARQACRYAFFLSFPLLFVFAGNRLAVWSVSEPTSTSTAAGSGISSLQGAIPTAEYLRLKELRKEGFKDPVKSKSEVKKFIGKHLAKAKKMDPATRVLLIILGAILLILILVLIAIIVSINESVDSCLGTEDDNSCL